MKWFLVLFGLFVGVQSATTHVAFGQDATDQAQLSASGPHRVRLAPRLERDTKSDQRWYPRPLTTQLGKVIQFDENQVSIAIAGEAVPIRFASQRVLDIELESVPSDQAEAIKSFRAGEFSSALPALIRSISEHDASSRPPVWRQQWLSMLAAQAAMRSGRGDIAIELVGQLDARPLPAMTLALLPVDWTGDLAKGEGLIEAAAERAASESLAIKLVAASWLLRDRNYRPPAEAALQRLAAQGERKRIALLARQLLWRTKSPPEIQAGQRQWENEISQLPMALRTGPMISLQHLMRRSGVADAAKKLEMELEFAPPTWHPDL